MKLFLVLFLVSLALVSFAADDKASPAEAKPTEPRPSVAMPKLETKYVSVGKLPLTKIGRNKAVEISIPVTVMPGHHIQSNPASNPQLIATKLELVGPQGVVIGEPIYPPGKPYRLQGSPTEISTYDGVFEVKVPVTASAKARPGEGRIAGKLRYQACNDKICFFPQTALVSIPIEVSK